MGVVGSAVIAVWSYELIKDSSSILLDGVGDGATAKTVRETLESDGATVAVDIHVWKLSPRDLAAAIAIVTNRPSTPDEYRARLTAALPSLSHVTLEVNRRVHGDLESGQRHLSP